jgi:hypothetical protein
VCVCVFVLLFVIVLIIAYVDFEDALAVRPSIRETGERQRHREREREKRGVVKKFILSSIARRVIIRVVVVF